MKAFQAMDSFRITGRGTGVVVTNPIEKTEDALIAELVGSTVILDGAERKVIGFESWLVPGRVVKAGAPMVILVKDL